MVVARRCILLRSMLMKNWIWTPLQPIHILCAGNLLVAISVKPTPFLLKLALGRVMAHVESVDFPELLSIDHTIEVQIKQREDQVTGVSS